MRIGEIVGKKITAAHVSPGEGDFYLSTPDGVIDIGVEGDCCSESWFSDVFNFDALIGTVERAEEIELPDYDVIDGRSRQEDDSVYGIRITTEKGSSTIAFRNSSNGYYGGWINRIEYSDPSVLADCKQITDDWKA